MLRAPALLWLGWAMLGSTAHAATALPTYPLRSITVYVPFALHSDNDYFTRLMAARISPLLGGAEFGVKNWVEDAGTQAAIATRNAPPDGYTLFAARLSTQALAPVIRPQLPYRWSDFSFIGFLEMEPLVCAARKDAAFEDTRGLLRALRKAPGTLTYGHAGDGTILSLAARYLMQLGGISTRNASGKFFPSASNAVEGLIKGKIDFLCTPAGGLLEAIRDQKVTPLFTTHSARMQQLPALPTARELGFADLTRLNSGTLLVGPPKLPAAIVAQWRQALQKMARDPAWSAALAKRSAIPMIGTLKDNPQFLKDQALFYERLIGILSASE